MLIELYYEASGGVRWACSVSIGLRDSGESRLSLAHPILMRQPKVVEPTFIRGAVVSRRTIFNCFIVIVVRDLHARFCIVPLGHCV